jgi:plasmid stabilization system protein ParE
MTYTLVVEPEAEAEIDEASRWYEAQNPGLGAEFLRVVDAAFGALQRNPLQYQIVYRQVRRAGLRRFPYGLVYRIRQSKVIVISCVHGRRHPRRWQNRT